MVNHTKLIRALTPSSLSNNTKPLLSGYLKGRTASCRCSFTLSSLFIPGIGSLRALVYPLPYLTSLPPHSTFSPTPMLMTALFPVPTPTLIRWLRTLLPIHQILKSGEMSGVWPFLLQYPISLYSRLNSCILAPILWSIWTTPFYHHERTLCILGMTFDPHFKLNAFVKFLVTLVSHRIKISQKLKFTKIGILIFHSFLSEQCATFWTKKGKRYFLRGGGGLHVIN